jgi:hypothetical protein
MIVDRAVVMDRLVGKDKALAKIVAPIAAMGVNPADRRISRQRVRRNRADLPH